MQSVELYLYRCMRIYSLFSFEAMTIQIMVRIKNMKNTQDKHNFPKTDFVLLPRPKPISLNSNCSWVFILFLSARGHFMLSVWNGSL